MVKENARINLTGKANSPSEELHIKEQNPLSAIGRYYRMLKLNNEQTDE